MCGQVRKKGASTARDSNAAENAMRTSTKLSTQKKIVKMMTSKQFIQRPVFSSVFQCVSALGSVQLGIQSTTTS